MQTQPTLGLGKKFKAEDYDKLSDIVEVWFDSGSTHSFVLELLNAYLPLKQS